MAYLRCLQSVKAAVDDGKRVRLVDLDVYFEPPESPGLAQEPAPYALQKYVSTVRKQIWRIADGTVDVFRNTKTRVLNVKNDVINTYEEAKSNPISMLRPGCITAAIIAGTIVPGRGKKPILRLASGTLGGTLAAGVAYPHKTVQIATGVYNKTKDATASLVEIMRKRAEENKTTTTVHDENATKHASHTSEVITASLGEGEFPEPEEETESAPLGVVEEKIQGDIAAVIASEISLPTAAEEGKEDVKIIEDVTTSISSDEIKIVKNAQGEDVCLVDIPAKEEVVELVGMKENSDSGEGKNISQEELVSADLKEEEMLETNQGKAEEDAVVTNNEEKIDDEEAKSKFEPVENQTEQVEEKDRGEVVGSAQNSSTEIETKILEEVNISETSKESDKEEWVVVDANEVPVVSQDLNENSRAAEIVNSASKHDIVLEDSSNEVNKMKEATKADKEVDYGQSNPEDKDMYSTRG